MLDYPYCNSLVLFVDLLQFPEALLVHRQHIPALLLLVLPLLRVHDLLQEDLVFRTHLLQGLLGAMVAGCFLAAAEERHVVAIG